MSFESKSLDQTLVEPVQSYVSEVFPQVVGVLGQLVKIPGIAWPAFDPENLEASANAVLGEFSELGFFDWVEIRRALKPDGELGSPAVLARRAAKNGAPHFLLYAHHDVQPPGDEALWDTSPFEATLKGDRLYGRGVSDDKSGIVTHLFALKALLELADKVDIGVTVFIEGEEEAGSESFENFLADNKQDMAADIIIVADSGNWTEDIPALTSSLRGVVSQDFTVTTMDHAVHSGMFGGPLPDAMTVMIKLLATLTDDNGDVAIEGLLSTPVDEIDLSDEAFNKDAGILQGVKRLGTKSLTQQIWGEPAVTIIGLDAPAVSTSSNTAQPMVRARVSLRLAPGQDPSAGLEILRAHLLTKVSFGAEISFGKSEKGPGYLAKNDWAAALAHEAFSAVWPNPSVNMGVGGSIPFISVFAETFPDAQILVTGVEEPDSRAHSPNESQHLPTLKRAIAAEALLLLQGNQIRA